MKEPEKAEIKRLSDQLDAVNHKSQPLLEAGDMEKLGELQKEKQKLEEEIARLRNVRVKKLSSEAQKLQKLTFSRAITKRTGEPGGSEKISPGYCHCPSDDGAGP